MVGSNRDLGRGSKIDLDHAAAVDSAAAGDAAVVGTAAAADTAAEDAVAEDAAAEDAAQVFGMPDNLFPDHPSRFTTLPKTHDNDSWVKARWPEVVMCSVGGLCKLQMQLGGLDRGCSPGKPAFLKGLSKEAGCTAWF